MCFKPNFCHIMAFNSKYFQAGKSNTMPTYHDVGIQQSRCNLGRLCTLLVECIAILPFTQPGQLHLQVTIDIHSFPLTGATQRHDIHWFFYMTSTEQSAHPFSASYWLGFRSQPGEH